MENGTFNIDFRRKNTAYSGNLDYSDYLKIIAKIT